jgi:uncharacterized protein (TIGR04255 family)
LTRTPAGYSLPEVAIPKRYKNAPITEAVIEIRLRPPPENRALKDLAESLKPDFPNQAPMRLLRSSISGLQPEGPPLSQAISQANIGFRLSNPANSRALQLTFNGLAYSHLAPYTDWQTFRAEARPLWEKYRAISRDAKLVRCALRYINRIDIPGEQIELYDYFNLYPKIPTELPRQDFVAMALNVQMPQPDLDCMAVINQALSEPVKTGYISVILDIDVFRLGIKSWQDSDVWLFLDKLRDRKNEIFECCITDRTRGLIDQ